MAKKDEKRPLDEINHRWSGRALATTKIAANAVRLASRRLMSRDDSEVYATIGENLARELDRMKGLAMKVGQILSYFEGTLPPETHEALRKLQRGAQPLAFEKLVLVIEEAFGGPIGELFESIEEEPIAAASIGQVHRAVHRGRKVAVKIQYPDMRATFEADFSRIGKLAALPSLVTAVDGAALVRELRLRVLEECDYLREADHQRAFAQAFRDERQVLIPTVIDERTRETVLTSEWHDGEDFYSFAEHADASRKNAAALVLTHFAYRSFFELGTLNADPHPGNYLFPAGPAIVFLDFGCVHRFEADYVERERELASVVVHDRRAAFRDALDATDCVAHPKKFDYDAHWALMRHQYEPYLEKDFHFTFDYLRRGTEFSKPSNPNLRHLAIAPPWIWQQRLVWGLHAVLARLDARGNFRDVLLAALETTLRPLRVERRARPDVTADV